MIFIKDNTKISCNSKWNIDFDASTNIVTVFKNVLSKELVDDMGYDSALVVLTIAEVDNTIQDIAYLYTDNLLNDEYIIMLDVPEVVELVNVHGLITRTAS